MRAKSTIKASANKSSNILTYWGGRPQRKCGTLLLLYIGFSTHPQGNRSAVAGILPATLITGEAIVPLHKHSLGKLPRVRAGQA